MSRRYPNLLRFDLGPEEIFNLTEEIIKETNVRLDRILQIPPKERTFQNTIKALEDADGYIQAKCSNCYFPSYVSINKAIRDASTQANEKLNAFNIQCSMRVDLYKSVLEYIENNPLEVSSIQGEDKRLLEKILQAYKRNGLSLPEEKQKKLKQIKEKISQLSIKFQQNLNEEVTKLAFSKEELEGMPEDFFENLPKENDTYLVSLKYPEFFPVMCNCRIENTRRRLEFAYSSQCMSENTVVLEELVKLRKEEAELLGYEDHASYILEIKMAKTPKAVLDFLNDLSVRLEEPAKREIIKLLELQKKDKESRNEYFDGQLHIWNWRYYDNLLLQTEYEINEEFIKEYFPLDKVTKGLLEIYQEVLGLKFRELPPQYTHVWHEDVKQFEVYDSETTNFMGHFYLDLFPREGKYGHAAEFDLQKGFDFPDGTRHYAAAAMVANFNKPTPTKQSLLRFNEVVTFFHEFGHVMHEICTTVKYLRFSGTNVERDFVEAPSQMFENWVYNETVLGKLSGHYRDGQPLPNELRQKLINAKNINKAIKTKRQLHFGTFDIIIHTSKEPIVLGEVWNKCMKEIALFPAQPGTNGATGFTHLVGGYSAGYYGYLWSEVYSSDMFLKFKKEGILNSKLGQEYRKYILAPGGSVDSMNSLILFLGRPPSLTAFLEDLGLQ